jgi:co-chaperonin GroES (HSP10)
MKLRPLQDRVLVRRVEQEARSSGGVIIPDTAQEKPKSLPSALVRAAMMARCTRSTSRPATACCSANGPVPRSSSMARTS